MYTLDSVIEAASEVVKNAGELLLESVDSNKIISKKGTANFVTEIDINVQKLIIKQLKDILPESNFIAEETEKNDFTLGKYTWVLDPVDGTTNLMYGYKYSAISLGLVVDGIPSGGIIFNPYLNELYVAQKGKGAYVNGQRIHVTENQTLHDSLITFGTSPYDRKKADETFRLAHKVFLSCRDVRRTGCVAIDLCNLAAGRMDGFFELELQPWDYAAGAVIVQEAGGKISDWSGNDLDFVNKRPVVASNGYIHKELLDKVQ